MKKTDKYTPQSMRKQQKLHFTAYFMSAQKKKNLNILGLKYNRWQNIRVEKCTVEIPKRQSSDTLAAQQ